MVYQGFKVLRRNPTFYNPRSAGMVALSYFAYSYYVNKYYKPANSNFEEYNSSHPHDQDEKVRQYHERTNQAIRDAVLEKRAELQQSTNSQIKTKEFIQDNRQCFIIYLQIDQDKKPRFDKDN